MTDDERIEVMGQDNAMDVSPSWLELRDQRDAAIAHAGECRAVLDRIVDIWDGPLYRHEMLPAISWAREVLKGGEVSDAKRDPIRR